MLEVISWTVPADPGSPIVKYVNRHGPRAALHHVTFLVDSVDAMRDRCRELGYEFMQGRDGKHWKEIYLRAPFFEPPKMLIQVLEADKAKLKEIAGDTVRTHAPAAGVAPSAGSTRIVGVRMACSDLAAAVTLFETLLGGTARGRVLSWPRSPMTIELLDGGSSEDSHVLVAPPDGQAPQRQREAPTEAVTLIRSAAGG